MRKKKVIAIGLSVGLALNSLSVSAAEYETADIQNEEQEDFSSQSEIAIEGEDFEEDSAPPEVEIAEEDLEEGSAKSEEEIESKDVGDFSSEPEEAESEDLTAVSEQSEVVRISGTCGENVTFKLTTDGVLTLSGSGSMRTIEYDWKEYKPSCGWGDYISSIKKILSN